MMMGLPRCLQRLLHNIFIPKKNILVVNHMHIVQWVARPTSCSSFSNAKQNNDFSTHRRRSFQGGASLDHTVCLNTVCNGSVSTLLRNYLLCGCAYNIFYPGHCYPFSAFSNLNMINQLLVAADKNVCLPVLFFLILSIWMMSDNQSLMT